MSQNNRAYDFFINEKVHCIIKGNRRHRYISFRVELEGNDAPFTKVELIQTLRQQTQDLFSKTTKELGLWVIHFDGTIGIIKCDHTEKERTIQLLHSMKKIGLKSVCFVTNATSGTIRGIIDKN